MPGARLLFSLDPAVAHLNHGSYGAVPISVQRAQQRLRDEMENNPMRFFGRSLAERLTHTREHVARFLDADPSCAAFVPNTTTGITVALDSVQLQAGDEVVTTDHAYGAVDFGVQRRCAETGAVPVRVPLPLTPSDDEVLAALEAALTDRTRLVVVDQITSLTARLFPVAEIVALMRDRGVPVVVDAAHVPGMLPAQVSSIGADFWVGNLHKWAFAARGTAVLAVGTRWRGRMRTLVESWLRPDGYPGAVEYHGTDDYTAWLAAPAALYALRALGETVVREHNTRLVRFGQHLVATALDAEVSRLAPPGHLSMAVIPLPAGVAATEPAARELRERISQQLDVEVAVSAWQGQGLLRLSAHVYNRPEDYERLADGLGSLLAHG